MNALRKKNAHYHPPEVGVLLGTVLDLQLDQGEERVTVDEWDGWQMLCDEDGMDRSAGKARLFLFEGELAHPAEVIDTEHADDTYERWHEREPETLGELDDLPEEIGFYQGRVLRLGYRSDKWGMRGNFIDYDHDFTERDGQPPKLYTDRAELEESRAAVLVGGDMMITERGID